MKLIATFLRLLYGTSIDTLLEELHARFIGVWLEKPTPDFIHPQCTWTLAEGHPLTGSFEDADFYTWYTNQFSLSYKSWKQVVSEVIGSPIGAIVVGRLHFKEQSRSYSAPFTHFYRIHQGKIINAQYYIGDKVKSIYPSDELIDMFPANSLPSLN